MKLLAALRFDDKGLIPAAVTDHESNRLLVLCYLNREALEKTLAEGKVYVYRRSQGRVVLKGATSGHVQQVEEIRLNCDNNSLEIRVAQRVGACHAGYFSCYYRRWDAGAQAWVEREERVFDPHSVYTRA